MDTTAHNDSWGLYPWFAEDDPDLIHPDDLEAMRALEPYGRVFQCVSRGTEYLTIRYRDSQFRVRPALYNQVPAPDRRFGERVKVKSNDTTVDGAVYDIMWHHKERRPFYRVMVEGKILKKRLWSEDML